MDADRHFCSSFNSNKRRRICSPSQKMSTITDLPKDLILHITTFSNIEDYAFSILLISKHFNQNLSPSTSPFIIKRLMQNECRTILGDSSPFNAFNGYTADQLTPWRDWILSASYAWQNALKIPRIQTKLQHSVVIPSDNIPYYHQERDKQWINCMRFDVETSIKMQQTQNRIKLKPSGDENNSFKNDQKNALLSSSFFLHILYQIRYGGFTKMDDIRSSLEKLLYSYGGALGFRYLLWFLVREFVANPLERGAKDYIIKNKIHKIVRDFLNEIWLEFGDGIRFHNIDYRKEWYVGQQFRDIDQIQSQYIDVMDKIDEKRASIMRQAKEIYKSWSPQFYDEVYSE